MQTLFLVSSLNCYDKNEYGIKIPKMISNENGILDNLKSSLNSYKNFVFVASDPNNYEKTDAYFEIIKQSFQLTLPFDNYYLIDGRNISHVKELLEKADFIYLCGGHVPTQNKFFKSIDLKNILENCSAVIMGASAGSMNMADIVYAEPEEEGESVDPNYKIYLEGLGLTNFSIIPHFLERMGATLDGKDILRDLSLPNSRNRPFIAFSDGDYIMQKDGRVFMYGKSFLFKNGKYCVLTSNGETDITNTILEMYKN